MAMLPRNAMLAFFCVMIRREVLDTVGLLDRVYGVGFGDDDDYCRRAHRANWRLVLTMQLRIPHRHRTTFKSLYSNDMIADMQRENMAIFKSDKPNYTDRRAA